MSAIVFGHRENFCHWTYTGCTFNTFESIKKRDSDPFSIAGVYGSYIDIKWTYAYIAINVYGSRPLLNPSPQVLMWAELRNENTPGMIEAYYCNIEYYEETDTAEFDVATMYGTDINLFDSSYYPSLWCSLTDEKNDCSRWSTSPWKPYKGFEDFKPVKFLDRENKMY